MADVQQPSELATAITTSFYSHLRLSTPLGASLESTTFLHVNDLLTRSSLKAYHIGTGLSVIKLICRELLHAQSEILFVTGFWASSSSRELLNKTLRLLNDRTPNNRRIRVRIGFSSSGLLQKILHTSSKKGKIHDPTTWSKLGLPSQSEIQNLDVEVKTLFFRPVGLLHGKFVVIDRQRLMLPSANVSWEEWYEGIGMYEGGIVDSFSRFWDSVWDDRSSSLIPVDVNRPQRILNDIQYPLWLQPEPALLPLPQTEDVDIIFLPHPHQPSLPPFTPLAYLPDAIYRLLVTLLSPLFARPPTIEREYLSNPQNAFFIAAISNAKESIYLHTPNITSTPILEALLEAIVRGVIVEIVTSPKMMVLEQLVTAGRTTESCMKRLVKTARRAKGFGGIWVYYFTPETGSSLPNQTNTIKAVKTHVKMLIVDEEVVMCGSGNADRASWVTSQEVNVGIFGGKETARALRQGLVDGLAGRIKVMEGCGWIKELDPEMEYRSLDVRPQRRVHLV